MKPTKTTLICTVGTSLLNNLKRSEGELKKFLAEQNWQQLVISLLDHNNSDRVCGAEINSITSIVDKELIHDLRHLIFLVSDTDDGKNTGKLLKQYYENSKNPLRFQNVEYRILEGLKDDNVESFKKQGLKNLVKEISEEVRKISPETIIINATGGYKAQISFAGMIGQALTIPVYYLFEKFSEVIELPPQPVSLDLALWLNNYLLFEQLESENVIPKSEVEMDLDHEVLHTLIDQEADEDDYLVSLSAMGVLFNERCRLEFAKQETTLLSLIPKDDTSPDKKKISLRDDHGKDKLLAFSEKLCRSPYVTKIVNSLPFNSHQKTPIRRTKPNGIIEFVLTWTDQGYGVCIQTTGRNLAETNTIALHLQKEFTN
jgi:putative CRISPR-associated protein (TIGR02619 family)